MTRLNNQDLSLETKACITRKNLKAEHLITYNKFFKEENPKYTPIEIIEMWDQCLYIIFNECNTCPFSLLYCNNFSQEECWSHSKKEMLLNYLIFLGVEI